MKVYILGLVLSVFLVDNTLSSSTGEEEWLVVSDNGIEETYEMETTTQFESTETTKLSTSTEESTTDEEEESTRFLGKPVPVDLPVIRPEWVVFACVAVMAYIVINNQLSDHE